LSSTSRLTTDTRWPSRSLLKLTTPGVPIGGADGSRAAVVRCTLAGRCEPAGQVYRQSDPGVFRAHVQLPE
jgi:hypothetical protein